MKDDVFEMFMLIEEERLKLHTVQEALLHGSTVFERAYKTLLDNSMLMASFSNIFTSYSKSDKSLHKELYTLLLDKYVPLTNNTFRKRVIEHYNVEKEQALRSSLQSSGKVSENRFIVY